MQEIQESHETRQAYFPTEEQRRKDKDDEITTITQLFLFLKLNFAGNEFIEVDASEEILKFI